MAYSLSRRQMMKMSAGALLAANLWPGRARAADPATKPLKFIQVNDLHYTEDACAPFFEGMVKAFNNIQGAALVLIAGDLTDGGTLGQCHALHDILGGLKMPCYVSPGNHEAGTQNDRGPFESVFGGKFDVTFEAQGWQFVGVDTTDGMKVNKFDCRKETLDFAASLPAKLDRGKPAFVYTHMPLGPGVPNRLQNADALLEPFKGLNVAAIFTGHHHAFTQKTVLREVIVTTNVCCSRKRANHDNTFEKGFFVIEAAEGKWKRTFVEYGTDFPGSATPKDVPLPATRPAVTDASRPSF